MIVYDSLSSIKDWKNEECDTTQGGRALHSVIFSSVAAYMFRHAFRHLEYVSLTNAYSADVCALCHKLAREVEMILIHQKTKANDRAAKFRELDAADALLKLKQQ